MIYQMPRLTGTKTGRGEEILCGGNVMELISWSKGEYPVCAVVPDGGSYTIFVVDALGGLRIFGEHWKECPGLRCRRPYRRSDPSLCRCTRNRVCNCGSPTRAKNIAGKIAEILHENREVVNNES